MLGIDDRLIEPVSVVAQYRALLRSSPDAVDRTYLKALPEAGHIEVTLSPEQKCVNWILEILKGTPQAADGGNDSEKE